MMERHKTLLAAACMLAAFCVVLLELLLSRDSPHFLHTRYLLLPRALNFNAAEQRSKRPPTCLIIGVRKGGTRALLNSMALHPQIRAARREVHFFDRNSTYELLGEKWYSEQIPTSNHGQEVVEKSPAYFTNPLVPERVKRFNPAMKLVLIVRDPVTRAISDYTQVRQTKLERRKSVVPFEKAIFIRNASGSTCLNVHYKPLGNSLYAIHFAPWLEHFPLEQFLIVDGDNFIIDPLTELRRVEHFLGLEPKIRADQLVFESNKGFYCFRRRSSQPAKCLGKAKGRRQFQVRRELRQQLANHLHPYNLQFFAQVGRSFPGWNAGRQL